MTIERIANTIEFELTPLEALAEDIKGRWRPSGHGSVLEALFAVQDEWVLINVKSYLRGCTTQGSEQEQRHRRFQLVEALHRHLVPL